MVQAYRLLAHEMYKLGWDYPMHLGVTEAGEGEDGRMKSAIGIGSLLVDGLGDTIRVSLTEDPELELVPCSALVKIGEEFLHDDSKYSAIPAWTESTASRDFQNFKKRRGDLPSQLEGDKVDVRGLMHRDGSVFSTVSLEDLRNPNQLYVSLGAKTLFGLPFKDIATSDSIYLPEVPPVEDAASRRTLKRLQEAGVGVLADIEKLVLTPIDNSVTITPHTSLSAGLPALTQGSIRG